VVVNVRDGTLVASTRGIARIEALERIEIGPALEFGRTSASHGYDGAPANEGDHATEHGVFDDHARVSAKSVQH
jgi:hypothetical protein